MISTEFVYLMSLTYNTTGGASLLLQVGFEFRRGAAEIVQLNTVRFKPKLFLGQFGVEVRCGRVVKVAVHASYGARVSSFDTLVVAMSHTSTLVGGLSATVMR